jgi:hypothetical protein
LDQAAEPTAKALKTGKPASRKNSTQNLTRGVDPSPAYPPPTPNGSQGTAALASVAPTGNGLVTPNPQSNFAPSEATDKWACKLDCACLYCSQRGPCLVYGESVHGRVIKYGLCPAHRDKLGEVRQRLSIEIPQRRSALLEVADKSTDVGVRWFSRLIYPKPPRCERCRAKGSFWVYNFLHEARHIAKALCEDHMWAMEKEMAEAEAMHVQFRDWGPEASRAYGPTWGFLVGKHKKPHQPPHDRDQFVRKMWQNPSRDPEELFRSIVCPKKARQSKL